MNCEVLNFGLHLKLKLYKTLLTSTKGNIKQTKYMYHACTTSVFTTTLSTETYVNYHHII